MAKNVAFVEDKNVAFAFLGTGVPFIEKICDLGQRDHPLPPSRRPVAAQFPANRLPSHFGGASPDQLALFDFEAAHP